MTREERAEQVVEQWWPRKNAGLAKQMLYQHIIRALHDVEYAAYEQGYRDAEAHAQRAWDVAMPIARGEPGTRQGEEGEEGNG